MSERSTETDWHVDRTEEEHHGYVIRYRPWDGDWEDCCVVSFEAYQIVGITTGGKKAILFEREDGRGSMDTCESFDEAQIYLHGQVKWDGCSDWIFDEQESCMLHFCGRSGIAELNRLFEEMYRIAKDVMPRCIF